MKETILKEVISIRNRLGTIITEAEPKIGKDWVMFERIVAAHKNLRGIEIDKSAPMGSDENQPMLPGTPPRVDNICPTCANFESCEFGIKKQGGVPDCENYILRVPEDDEEESVETHDFTKIQDMPHTELSEEEKAKLTEIKQDVTQEPVSLASFEVVKTAEHEGEEHTVSMCGHTASHKTLRGAVMFLFQDLGFIYQTPEDMKEAIMKFPDCDKRGLIIGILDSDEETKKRSRRKKE